LQLMANGLTSGLNLQQSLQLVADEARPPTCDEFRWLLTEIHVGRRVDTALRQFAERVALEDVRLTIEAIVTLRETGGNLSETFQVIANTLIERNKVSGKIKAMTMQGRVQGVLVSCLPVALLLVFFIIDPLYVMPFFTTSYGVMMLALIAVLDLLGILWIRKLVEVAV
jgi:tight adherence protein B